MNASERFLTALRSIIPTPRVGCGSDSGVTRRRARFRRALALSALALVGLFIRPAAADVRVGNDERPDAPTWLIISGTITKNDVVAITAALERQKNGLAFNAPELIVGLNSDGGDVDAAIEIGRLIRTRASLVGTLDRVAPLLGAPSLRIQPARCTSACVLILCSGGIRLGGNLVGIHRPYSLLRARSYDAALPATGKIKSYLEEMGMPAQFYDEMMQVSPESVRWLSDTEQETFGIAQSDRATLDLARH